MRIAYDHLGWLGNLINLGFGPDGGQAFYEKYGRVKVQDERGKTSTVKRIYKTVFFSGHAKVRDYQCQQRFRKLVVNPQVTCDIRFWEKDDQPEFSENVIFNFVSGSLKSIQFVGQGRPVNG